MNTNCLAGMQCPKCGSFEPFTISISTLIMFHDAGSNPASYGDLEWNNDSYCQCDADDCDYIGIVANFRAAPSSVDPGQ